MAEPGGGRPPSRGAAGGCWAAAAGGDAALVANRRATEPADNARSSTCVSVADKRLMSGTNESSMARWA